MQITIGGGADKAPERGRRELVRVNVRLAPEVRERVRVAAAEDGVSAGAWMARAIARGLDARGEDGATIGGR